VSISDSPESTDARPQKRFRLRNNSGQELPIILTTQVLKDSQWQENRRLNEKFRLLSPKSIQTFDFPSPRDGTQARLQINWARKRWGPFEPLLRLINPTRNANAPHVLTVEFGSATTES
jgi:hypothetical protein